MLPVVPAASMEAFAEALASSYFQGVEVQVLDLAGNLVTSLQPQINSGQVDLDVDRDVTRSATAEFYDPNRSLQFDPDSPNDSAVYFIHQLRISHVMNVPGVGKVRTPMITGPLVKFDRSGDNVSLEVQGRESLALNGVAHMVFRHGKNAVDTIEEIMRRGVGESHFSLPSHKGRLPKDVIVGHDDKNKPWTVCKSIAKSIGMQLYYNGRGVLCLRDIPKNPVFTFHTGEKGNLTQVVQVTHDKSLIKNRVVVTGSKPAHRADVILENSPMSAKSLAVNGVPQYLWADPINSSKIRSKAAAHKRGVEELAKYASLTFGATFNAVPVPHLDELDPVFVDTDEFTGTQRLRAWSLPLTGGEMTVGYNDRVTLPRKNIRHA